MSNEHPVTPPDELVQELWNDYHRLSIYNARTAWEDSVVKAYRAGADAELDANDAWIRTSLKGQLRPANWVADNLRAARRPKPPSLAEQGQRILVENGTTLDGRVELDPEDVSTIRAALERLQELEKGNE